MKLLQENRAIRLPSWLCPHLVCHHRAQPCQETNMAAVEHHFESDSVRQSDVILGSLNRLIAFVVNLSKLKVSASVVSNSPNRKTGVRNLFHELCTFLSFSMHATRHHHRLIKTIRSLYDYVIKTCS